MWKLGVCQVDGFLNQTHHFWVEKNSTQLITTQLITRVHIQPTWVELDFIFITKKKKKTTALKLQQLTVLQVFAIHSE